MIFKFKQIIRWIFLNTKSLKYLQNNLQIKSDTVKDYLIYSLTLSKVGFCCLEM